MGEWLTFQRENSFPYEKYLSKNIIFHLWLAASQAGGPVRWILRQACWGGMTHVLRGRVDEMTGKQLSLDLGWGWLSPCLPIPIC